MKERNPHVEPVMALALCIIVVGFLFQFAWRFADERLYADSGYYLFRVVNESSFHVEHGRWVLALAELPAWLGLRSGASMGTLVVLHSLSNVFFLLLALAYCFGVLKDRRAAVMVAMAQLLGLTHGLFCPVFELYYGVVLLLLLLATLDSARLHGWWKLLPACVLLLLALSSHPMAWLLLTGGLPLLDRIHLRPFLRPAAVIVLAFIVVRWWNMSVYESAQLAFVQRLGQPSLVLGLFTPTRLLERAAHVLPHYPDVVALLVLTLALGWRHGRRRTVLVGLIGLFALHLLTGLYLADLTHDRYREQVDFSFAAWALVLTLTNGWSIARWRPMLLVLLVVCVGYRIMQTWSIAPFYQARTQWHKGHIEQARARGLHKVIIDPKGIAFGTVHDRVAPYWSSGVESLLLSAQDGPDRVVSVITTDDLECPGVPEKLDQVVLRCWDVLAPGEMNMRYFAIPPGRYAPLNGIP